MVSDDMDITGVLKSKCFCDHENQIQCLNCFSADQIVKWRQLAMHYFLESSHLDCEHCEWISEWSKGKPNE